MTVSSFITGSHAYGVPTESSDVDLVVLLSEEDAKTLLEANKHDDWERASNLAMNYEGMVSWCFYYGNINIIAVSSESLFQVWKDGTEELKKRAPVTRDEAVEYLSQKRKEWFNG